MTSYEIIKTWGIDQVKLHVFTTRLDAVKKYHALKKSYTARSGEIPWTLRLVQVTRKELNVDASHEPARLSTENL